MAASTTSTASTRKRTRKKKRFQALRRAAKRAQAWALAWTTNGAARPTVRFERGGAAARLTISGSANHSLLVAARNIHLQAPFVLVPITFIALIALVTFGVAITNAVGSPATSKPMFTAGQRYALDIAVLPFQPTSTDSACRDMAGDLASEVALRMNDSLRPNTLSGDAPSTVRVWPPDQIPMGNLSGAGSPGEQANRLVVERGADVVLYGTVDCTGDNITVTPGFVVAPAYVQYAPELYGSYALGSFSHAISQRIDNMALAEIKSEIASRASAMAMLIQGFDYYARGSESDYDKAIERFNRAISWGAQQVPDISAIAHVFIGNANFGAAKGDCGAGLDPARLDQAQQHYQAALAAEPETALAYLGLGNVMTQRAFYLSANDAGVREYLQQADGYFTSALAAAMQPTAANVEWKVLYGQALAKLIERDFTDDTSRSEQLLDEAESIADQLLSKYLSGSLDGAAADSIAVHTYMMLGEIKTQRFSNDGALVYFAQAMRHAKEPRIKSLIAIRTATAKNNLGDVCGAAEQYQAAVSTTACETDKLEYATLARDFEIQCEAHSAAPD